MAECDTNAFWNVNVKEADQTVSCPSFLQYCFENDKDRKIIGTPDKDFQRMSWPDVTSAVKHDRPDLFVRVPSELRRYREYCQAVQEKYGSIMQFMLQERLKWKDTEPMAEDFENTDNYTILYNDWPYGIDERIVHLVVWTKFSMPEEPGTDRLMPEMQQKIETFVARAFRSCCSEVIWFRNWTSLKSIHAVEHFHVMLYDPPMDAVARLTHGDEPLAYKLGYISKK